MHTYQGPLTDERGAFARVFSAPVTVHQLGIIHTSPAAPVKGIADFHGRGRSAAVSRLFTAYAAEHAPAAANARPALAGPTRVAQRTPIVWGGR